MLVLLKRKEELLRAGLKHEFEEKMKVHAVEQEKELAHKKQELANELQEKARALLS
jgi:hypothetical protein